MKLFKTTFLFIFGSLALLSCEKEDNSKNYKNSINKEIHEEKETKKISLEQFSQENVSLFDARVRSIDENNYVRELFFVNFSDKKLKIKNTYFRDVTYSDDGKGNDLVALDGVFTSVRTYKYGGKIQYDKENPIQSVLAEPIVSPNFIQQKKLTELEMTYEYREFGEEQKPVTNQLFQITCGMTFTGGGCNACDWFGGGWCDWCFTIDQSDCDISIGW